MRSLRTPPTSKAIRAKYGKELRPISKVPSMSATTVCFSLPIEVHLFTVGKVEDAMVMMVISSCNKDTLSVSTRQGCMFLCEVVVFIYTYMQEES